MAKKPKGLFPFLQELSMGKRYIVRLNDEERQQLQALVTTGKAIAYKIKHANILLNIDINRPLA
jgi:hypothetical protein